MLLLRFEKLLTGLRFDHPATRAESVRAVPDVLSSALAEGSIHLTF